MCARILAAAAGVVLTVALALRPASASGWEVRREIREERWDRNDRDGDVLTGIVVGVTVIGVAAAIADSDD